MLAEGIWTSCFRFRLAPPTFFFPETIQTLQTPIARVQGMEIYFCDWFLISPGKALPLPFTMTNKSSISSSSALGIIFSAILSSPNNPLWLDLSPAKKGRSVHHDLGENTTVVVWGRFETQTLLTRFWCKTGSNRQHTTGKQNYKVNCFTTHTTQKKAFSENYVSNNCLKFPSKNVWRFCPVLSSTLSGSKSSSLAHVRSNALSIVHLSSFGSGLPNGPCQKLVAMQRPLQHIATKEQICWQNATCSWRVAPDFSQFICKSAFKRCCFRSISTKLKRQKKTYS